MTYFAGPAVLAPVGTTGNNTHTGVGVSPADSHCAVLTVEVVGATPTVTLSLQGSLDGNIWNTLGTINSNTANTSTPASTQVLTAVGSVHTFTVPGMFFNFIRLVSSANTNVTYSAKLYSKGV